MDEFSATLSELTEEYERQARRIKEAYAELNKVEVSVQSDDEMVTVTVGPRGQVRRIELNPRVYRRLSPTELANAITEQITRATAAVADRSRELVGPLLPEGLPYEEIFGEGADLDSLLPYPGSA
ncbi:MULTISPECIES: YbaB/EbfC family nucleoid-associated protein [unclassified Nonomuraea]